MNKVKLSNKFALVKSIKPIPFTGHEADWHAWLYQFKNQVNLAGLAHMLLNINVTKPTYALVRLCTCLSESMPLEWRIKFSTLPTIKVEEEKESKVSSTPKASGAPVITVDDEERMTYFPIAHPALCYRELLRHYERADEVTVNALWAQLERCKMGNLSFDQFVQQLTILFSRLDAAGETVPMGKQNGV